MFDKSPKCALIMAPCPKTSDDSAPIYCPNWVEHIPEVEKDGTGRVIAEVFYTGCQLRRQVLYMLSMTASAGQAAASADKAATEANIVGKVLLGQVMFEVPAEQQYLSSMPISSLPAHKA